MSRIQNTIDYLETCGYSIDPDYLLESATGKDIKEYIIYSQNELHKNEETIRELINENVRLKVKLGLE